VITGHNTDVEYAGRVYHVQTEDKGAGNPLIETLVYSRGAILDCRRSSYAELVKDGPDEKGILLLLEQQHARMVREVRNGKYDPAGPKPFGYNLISNRTLDEIVLEWLAADAAGGGMRILLTGEDTFYSGTQANLAMTVEGSGEPPVPLEGAVVSVRLIGTKRKAAKVFEGKTGAQGTIEASLTIPDLGGSQGALVFQVRHKDRAAEMTRPVLPSP
jgi:hypothetical protein